MQTEWLGVPSFLDDELSQRTARLEACLERLKANMRLAVIFGGNTSAPNSVLYRSQNTRSWKSYEVVATDIADSLRRLGFHHVHLMPDDMQLGERLRRDDIHMAWLNTGGIQGYNPAAHAAAMLEMFGMPYIGHDPLTATILDNKHAFKREAVSAGLATAPFVTWHGARGDFQPDVNSRFRRAFKTFSGPFVVKPVSGRASLHVHFVDEKAGLADAVEKVYRETGNVVLIERYLPGREFCVAVAGPIRAREGRLVPGRAPFVFAGLERLLTPNEKIFTSMDVRPITCDRCRILDRHRDSRYFDELQALAREVFLEFNLHSLVRIDMRCDEKGKLYILEANPKPDLKRPVDGVTSLISLGLPGLGMDYDDLILSLLADRLGFLLAHRRDTVGHVVELLDVEPQARVSRPSGSRPHAKKTATGAYRRAAAEASLLTNKMAAFNAAAETIAGSAGDQVIATMTALATETNVTALNAISEHPASRKSPRPVRSGTRSGS
jgi:D-alanine-D-alanine ligase